MTLPIEHPVSAIHACASSLHTRQTGPASSRGPLQIPKGSSPSRLSTEPAAAAHLLLLLLL